MQVQSIQGKKRWPSCRWVSLLFPCRRGSHGTFEMKSNFLSRTLKFKINNMYGWLFWSLGFCNLEDLPIIIVLEFTKRHKTELLPIIRLLFVSLYPSFGILTLTRYCYWAMQIIVYPSRSGLWLSLTDDMKPFEPTLFDHFLGYVPKFKLVQISKGNSCVAAETNGNVHKFNHKLPIFFSFEIRFIHHSSYVHMNIG